MLETKAGLSTVDRMSLERILYVGGFVPEAKALSPHLQSRFEVERVLASRSARLTALRCGIVIGPRSSSFWILRNLVRRLPFMLLPRWTESRTQPVALRDLIRAVVRSLSDPATMDGAFDIAGPDVMTYRELMHRVARVMGVRRRMIGTRFFSPRFSRLWVTLFGSAPGALVTPLIESLRHDMVARDNPLQRAIAAEATPLDDAIAQAIEPVRADKEPVTLARRAAHWRGLREARRARSVQRLPLPAGDQAIDVAREYLRFLPRFANPWIRVEVDAEGVCRFYLAGTRWLLMRLFHCRERSNPDRQVFLVGGGALVRRDVPEPGRLEFRTVEGQVLAAVHDFAPSLPWSLYEQTQARVHLFVMHRFERWLAELDRPVAEAALVPAPEAHA